MKYQAWMEEWLCFEKPMVKSGTYRRLKYYISSQVVPALGGYELEELSGAELSKFVTELTERYSPGTVNGIVSIVKRSLSDAEEMEVAGGAKAGKIRYRYKREYSPKCLTQKDQRKLEEYVKASGEAKLYGIMICLYTGLRVGELLALSWSDVDLKAGTLKVSKTCNDDYESGKYEKVIDTPKTRTSRREIPLPKQIVTILKELKRQSESEFVISGKGGKVISKRSYQNTFGIVLKRLGIPHMGPWHDFYKR